VVGRGRHAKRGPIDGMQRQVNRVHAALARTGRDDVPVEAALCFVNDNAGLDGRRCKRVDGVLSATGPTAPGTATPPSVKEVLAHHAEFRLRAVARARGPVRGPRVTRTGTNVVLAYRRGSRCRVTVTVDRMLPHTIDRPIVASTGCRRR
jgi:hypothetical protein